MRRSEGSKIFENNRPQTVNFGAGRNLDSFGRLPVSQLQTQLDAKQLHDKLPLFFSEELIGAATATHSTTDAHTALEVVNNLDAAIMQTRQRFNYQSAKGQLLYWTFNQFDNQADTTKRIGYFSSNTTTPFNSTLDGIFLQSDGTNLSVNTYREGTQTATANRSSWYDPLDGTGPSGITHNFNNNTILAVQFEWLGVGEVQFFIIKNSQYILFHRFDFTDTTRVYMSSPNQPMRWECRASAGTGGTGFNFICSSVNSEGALNKLGKILSSNLGTTHVNANSTSTKYALLGIRLQSAKVDTLVDLINYSILATTSDNQLVEIWLNPTVAGTFTYSSVTNSSVQIAKGAAAGTNTVTGGTLLYSKYVSGQNATPINLENAIRLGMEIDGTLDEIVLTTNPLTSNSDVLASEDWRELT